MIYLYYKSYKNYPMNKIKILSFFIIIASMTLSIQASTSCNKYNELSPLVTFNEGANKTITYTPDHNYQKALKENMAIIKGNITNLPNLPYNEKVVYIKKTRNEADVKRRMWATIESKRTTDYPFLLQQQEEIKSLKNELSYNKKIINLMVAGLIGTTATCLYVSYICNCNSNQK